ncbi:uncharacterized protein LOC110860631 isoform X3 [Folsomia candida]|uniref:uncharacterized protein LOC110860631 isoform X3 n=1 Tax=Folsomia candida TaxID=158441 RepID=UPI000B8F4F68|nr:uncharacterized protein LOC110860631 isoform X3 [Folsomia candida]
MLPMPMQTLRRRTSPLKYKHDPARFLGEGLTFKGKLIGVLEVSGPRGDRICQEALSDLKMAVKAAGEHKQKVTVHVALDGLRIRDEKTGDCLYHHQVHKISFIAQDLTDTRAFGYIFGSPDTGHRFFGIKTEKSASQVVISMRDLFQVVFDFKKKEIEKAKQQLEMQQKFLATRAQETAPPSKKTEPKFAIAETYIEGAGAAGISRPVPNRVAPEVDLLNLEVELTSLQEGLDNIHHNLQESLPFRGSTASISSDPMNPMPKRSSVSSSNANNTTPVPSVFGGGVSDPFGDSFSSFDPFTETSGPYPSATNFQLGTTSSKVGGSALTCSFTSDPFAQVDPFPKYPGDTDFFNSDPFDSPSGPMSFSFPAPEAINTSFRNSSDSSDVRLQRGGNINGGSPAPRPKFSDNHQQEKVGGKEKVGWTASFEDNFVPETAADSVIGMSNKPHRDVFKALDPLEVRRGPAASGFTEMSVTKMQQYSMDGGGQHLPNSFSSNFSPSTNNQNNAASSELELKTPVSTFNARAESPPNYSPPPPPRVTGSPNPLSSQSGGNNNTHQVPHILPPATSSPRLGKKKSPQILKQISIAESTLSSSSSSPNKAAFPTNRATTLRIGKTFTMDSSFKDDIPNLSPPPRPPHGQQTGGGIGVSGGTLKSGSSSLSSALPRPTSGSSDKGKKLPGNVSVIGLPPEPPPRPLQSSSSTTVSNHPLQLVSPPPPLPPKKQSLSSTMSTPLGLKQHDSKKPLAATFSSRSATSESNDLPLPLPLRKVHHGGAVSSEQQSNLSSALHNSGGGGRYAVPESNRPFTTSSPHTQRRAVPPPISTPAEGKVALSMEQALTQVASLSLRDLAVQLELPVDQLSSYTIQQLAHKLTEMNLSKKTGGRYGEISEPNSSSHQFADNKSDFGGFDDDFSTASAPPRVSVQKGPPSGFDRYAVFRELALEDASGFSIVNNVGSMDRSINSDDDEQSTTTLEKQFASDRESSSERTLQADDLTEPTHLKSASFATANMANTMDDVTDVNFSDDQDNGKFTLDDDDDDIIAAGFVKNEWATFESNFDDQFAMTALVKAEEGNESPWDSDDGAGGVVQKSNVITNLPPQHQHNNDQRSPRQPHDHFDFKPFEKPPELVQSAAKERVNQRKYSEDDGGDGRFKSTSTPEGIRSPATPGQFQRQSSGSSRQSERSSGGGGGGGNNPPATGGKVSDYSDSGKGGPGGGGGDRPRRHRQDLDRSWEFDREGRDGSGRYNRERGGDRDRDRDRDYRPDSRSSYTSIPRKYRNGDSGDEDNSVRRVKSRVMSGSGGGGGTYRRRSKDYDREEGEDEDDDRSYASHHSNYSSTRRHRRYPSAKYYYSRSGRGGDRRGGGGGGAGSPDRYSNHESDDESMEEELYTRKRDRENYAREREYYERHHRPRPNSGSSTGGKQRYSPRHPDHYYRRSDRRRYKDDEDYGDSREFSEYSGEDDHPSSHSHHGGHRRVRAKRSTHYRDRDAREVPRGHYYTNSPSSRSDEAEKEPDTPGKSSKVSSQRRPNSGKDSTSRGGGGDERRRGESPEHYGSRRQEKEYSSSSRRYQSELALNSKLQDSPKLSSLNFEDDFGAYSLPSDNNPKSRNASISSPPLPQDNNHANAVVTDLVIDESPVVQNDSISKPDDLDNKKSNSPFEDDFGSQANGASEPPNLLIIDDDEAKQSESVDTVVKSIEELDLKIITSNENGIDDAGKVDTFPPETESKVFTYSGRRLESIKSEEEKSNDDSHSHSQNSEGIVQMKKSDSFNIFKQNKDPFGDDEFFT